MVFAGRGTPFEPNGEGTVQTKPPTVRVTLCGFLLLNSNGFHGQAGCVPGPRLRAGRSRRAGTVLARFSSQLQKGREGGRGVASVWLLVR